MMGNNTEVVRESLGDQMGIVDIRTIYLHFVDIYWVIGIYSASTLVLMLLAYQDAFNISSYVTGLNH